MMSLSAISSVVSANSAIPEAGIFVPLSVDPAILTGIGAAALVALGAALWRSYRGSWLGQTQIGGCLAR